ncbi:MAG: glycosyltransferase family 2 protein [Oligoflexia bacterium]|nr:glycosyltransferase family 2 protein [Oligoflexia bacterium]
MPRKKIAVVIPTYNVEKFIGPTLESVSWCDEIIIVDMLSTDGTKKLCTSYPNCRFLEKKDYIYANVNFGIEQASSDWILRLDSDEVLTSELKQSIIEILEMENPPFDGYYAMSNVFFMGYHLKHGFGKNNWRKTFFKKGFAKYNAQSEHEDLVSSGNWGKLKGLYNHYTNPTISAWVQKINYYTDKDIERLKQTKNISAFRILYVTLRWFQRYYFYPYQAFRDGMPGFIVACIAAAGLMILECKHWEKHNRLIKNKTSNHPNV